MAKIKINENIYEGKKEHHTQYFYMCKGCGHEHCFALKSEGGHHNFNMDLENPTVSPSLVQNFTPGKMCHSFIKNGKIQYLNDCYHKLKGQTIELPQIS
jgi:hypothetical protein